MGIIPNLGISLPSISSIAIIILVFFGLLIIIGGIIITIILKKNTIKILEIDMVSHQMRKYNARLKKDKTSNAEKLWFGKYKKWLKRHQQNNIFYDKMKEVLILLKDKNGLHHPMSIADLDIMKDLMKIKGIDIENEFIVDDITKENTENPNYNIAQIYSMPQPSEDLNWLGDICVESNLEYKKETPWYLSPNVMILGCAFVCMIMFFGTIILVKRFLG